MADSDNLERHVALLRGLNVGGRHVLPMRELADLFRRAGAADVRTYIQSGNVVFRAAPATVDSMARAVETAIVDHYGFASPVVVRSAEALQRAVAANPYAGEVSDPKRLHVGFLAQRPGPEAAAGLDPDRSPPDRACVVGRQLYLDLPNGAARTRFTSAYLDRTLGTVCTVRNWRTTLALLELAAGGG